MAKELLVDHLDSPPTLRGEYLHRMDGESPEEHLERITEWFSESIESGIPILFYVRCYQRTSDGGQPRMVFGHHVVITSLDGKIAKTDGGTPRIGFAFVDSSSGRVDHGDPFVAERGFTAPTFTYRIDEDRALKTEKVRTGRPLLEVRVPSYESSYFAGADRAIPGIHVEGHHSFANSPTLDYRSGFRSSLGDSHPKMIEPRIYRKSCRGGVSAATRRVVGRPPAAAGTC